MQPNIPLTTLKFTLNHVDGSGLDQNCLSPNNYTKPVESNSVPAFPSSLHCFKFNGDGSLRHTRLWQNPNRCSLCSSIILLQGFFSLYQFSSINLLSLRSWLYFFVIQEIMNNNLIYRRVMRSILAWRKNLARKLLKSQRSACCTQ